MKNILAITAILLFSARLCCMQQRTEEFKMKELEDFQKQHVIVVALNFATPSRGAQKLHICSSVQPQNAAIIIGNYLVLYLHCCKDKAEYIFEHSKNYEENIRFSLIMWFLEKDYLNTHEIVRLAWLYMVAEKNQMRAKKIADWLVAKIASVESTVALFDDVFETDQNAKRACYERLVSKLLQLACFKKPLEILKIKQERYTLDQLLVIKTLYGAIQKFENLKLDAIYSSLDCYRAFYENLQKLLDLQPQLAYVYSENSDISSALIKIIDQEIKKYSSYTIILEDNTIKKWDGVPSKYSFA